MPQKWFSIPIILLVVLVSTFKSSVKPTFGCARRSNKIKSPVVVLNDEVDTDDLQELNTMVDRHNTLYRDEIGTENSLKTLKYYGFFETKRKHVQCTNCVIVRYYLKQLKWIVEELIYGDHPDSQHFSRDLNGMKNHVVQMLSLLHALTCRDIQHWLWSFLFKLSAVQSWNENKQLVIDHFESYSALDAVLARFASSCLFRSYLPVGAPFDYNLPHTKTNSYTVRETVFRPLYDNYVFYKTFKYHSRFTVENVYLTRLWGKEQRLFVGNVPGVSIDWEPAKTLLAEQSASMQDFYTEKRWVHDPFGCVGYHGLMVDLIFVRLYSYFYVHLHVYNNLQADGPNDYWQHNKRLHYQLTEAFQSSQIGDRFVQTALDKFRAITIRYHPTDAYRLLRDIAEKIHKLLGLVPPEGRLFVENIMDVNVEDLTVEFLIKNLTGLIEYTDTLKNEFQPFDLSCILLFIDASAQDDDTFFAI